MGIWSSIGHAVLRYGPYAAAPFTGGASLALAPYANAADAAWSMGSQIKADQSGGAIQQSKAPVGRSIPPVNRPTYSSSGLGPTSLPSMTQQNSGNIFGSPQPTSVNTNSQLFNPTYGMMPQDSTNPNLSFALNQGKTNALMNQPWREKAGIYPNIPQSQRQFQPAPMPMIQQPTTFQQPGQGDAWTQFLAKNPDLMQMMSGR